MNTPERSAWPRALLWLTIVSLVLQSGCVGVAPPVPSSTVRQTLGVVAIAPAQYIPASNFVTFAKSQGAGAAQGAAIGAGGAAATAATATAFAGPYGPVLATVIAVVLIPVEGALGVVLGAQAAVPAETAKQVDSVINAAVAELDAQNVLAARIAAMVKDSPGIRLSAVNAAGPAGQATRPDYAQLRGAGVDTVLEIAITEIGFENCDSLRQVAYQKNIYSWSSGCDDDRQKRLIDLFVTAQARLVRVADGAELFVRGFRYMSPRREISLWVAKDGQMLAEEFGQAFRALAERVYDEALLVTSIELPIPSNWGSPGSDPSSPGICWLAPLYPKANPNALSEILATIISRPADLCPLSALHFSSVDTLRPTLRWDRFPRELDRRQLDAALLQKIGDVRYDLKIWQAEGCERGRLVYERNGLLAPEHALEQSLEPASRYFWSVRARFAVDGQPMAMRWSTYSMVNCIPYGIPDWQYHRFVTPR
jgi:hypothetical protein